MNIDIIDESDKWNYVNEKMKNKHCAIFDLDGTLVDTADDLGLATDYVLREYGVEPKWTKQDYRAFVGNGAKKLLDRAFEHKLSDSELDNALELFKKKYNAILLDHAHLYDGVASSLDELKKQGIKLAVVTNKPHQSAMKMVETLFGKNYFDVIIGATEDAPKKPDPYTANLALEKLGCTPDEAVFFGDSDIDVYTAKNAGMDSVGCSWGFRSFECLRTADPLVIIDSAEKISKLFKKV
ncbi:MAG: HAD-IIIA family hydrolase [Eubacterium sp.]|nr:HAD-IIIA family hydrolase [Eubacterium sp.]MDE6766835.1 HAD-IIIA family hydrolase [Eubacterium sp.]